MFCPNCGRANLESDNFCRYCGKRLKEEDAQDTHAPAQEPVESMPEPDSVTPPDTDFSTEGPEGNGEPEFPPFTPTPAPSAAPSVDPQRVLNTPAILVALIAISAALAFNLFSLADAFYSLSDWAEVEGMYAYFSFSGILSIVTLIPNALIVAGSWMVYASVKAGQVKETGLTIIKVALIIDLVFICLALGLAEIVLIFTAVLMFAGSTSADYDDISRYEFNPVGDAMAQGVVIFYIILLAAILVLAIIYTVKACKTMEVIRNSVVTGVPSDRISGFVAVMLCIAGGFVAISALNLLVYDGLLSALSGACSATAYICFGVFLFDYRSRMRKLMAERASL